MKALSGAGARIWRNNQGIAKYPDGATVKYGLCNPGGSDLVGFFPLKITSDMVGQTIAAFLAVEVKTPTGRATEAQLHFIEAVRSAGGIAGVVRGEEEALRLISLG